MVFIYGGAYQGKLDFAAEKYKLKKEDIRYFSNETEFNAIEKCLNGYHTFILTQIRAGIDPLSFLHDRISLLENKIIIADDISSGVVPASAETRKWREAAGRCANLLSKNAEEVWRVFCSIGTKIK